MTDTQSNKDIVTDVIDNMTGIANNMLMSTQTSMDNYLGMMYSLPDTAPTSSENIEFPSIGQDALVNVPNFTAALEEFNSENAAPPEGITLAQPEPVSFIAPTSNANYNGSTITAPQINNITPPGEPPALESITVPESPELDFPDIPSLDEITLPDKPEIDLSSFDATAPTFTNTAPPAELNYQPEPYNSDIKIELFKKILKDLENGGTGLDVEVEGELYARGLERQRVENERLYKEVEDQFSASGFTLPSGTYAARMLEVSNEISRKNDQLNRDIVISQAELAQKNTQFTTEQAKQLEKMLMDFYHQQESRSLEAAKAILQGNLEIYNATIEGKRLELDKYKTEAAVFESKIRAELSAVEVYRAQIEATKAESEIQLARVNIYNSQMAGLETLMKLYATEMESVKVRAEAQMSAVEVFKAQVEAYNAQLAAEKGKVDIYSAQLEGEKTKAIVYSEEVKAYQAEIEARKAEAEVNLANAEMTIKNNQMQIDQYRADVEAYKAEIAANVSKAQIKTEAFKAEASAYETEARVESTKYDAKMRGFSAKIEKARAEVDRQATTIQANSQSFVALKELQSKGLEGVMNVNAQLAASAMSAINASASTGTSWSNNESSSESMSESHNYSYDM